MKLSPEITEDSWEAKKNERNEKKKDRKEWD